MTLILTLSTGHGRHGRHGYDEPDDGNGRLREYIRLVTRSIMTSKSPAKHDSQGCQVEALVLEHMGLVSVLLIPQRGCRLGFNS